MAAAMAEHPGGSLPARHEGWAELTGAYRWLGNDAIDPAAVVASHAAVTLTLLHISSVSRMVWFSHGRDEVTTWTR